MGTQTLKSVRVVAETWRVASILRNQILYLGSLNWLTVSKLARRGLNKLMHTDSRHISHLTSYEAKVIKTVLLIKTTPAFIFLTHLSCP